MSTYTATIRWTRDPDADFAKGQYSRAHEWVFDGGVTVPASPSPHIVPPPWSDPAGVDPEEAGGADDTAGSESGHREAEIARGAMKNILNEDGRKYDQRSAQRAGDEDGHQGRAQMGLARNFLESRKGMVAVEPVGDRRWGFAARQNPNRNPEKR